MKQLQPKLTAKIVKDHSSSWYGKRYLNPLPIRCNWGRGAQCVKDFTKHEHANWFISLYNLIVELLKGEAKVIVDEMSVEISTKKSTYKFSLESELLSPQQSISLRNLLEQSIK